MRLSVLSGKAVVFSEIASTLPPLFQWLKESYGHAAPKSDSGALGSRGKDHHPVATDDFCLGRVLFNISFLEMRKLRTRDVHAFELVG